MKIHIGDETWHNLNIPGVNDHIVSCAFCIDHTLGDLSESSSCATDPPSRSAGHGRLYIKERLSVSNTRRKVCWYRVMISID